MQKDGERSGQSVDGSTVGQLQTTKTASDRLPPLPAGDDAKTALIFGLALLDYQSAGELKRRNARTTTAAVTPNISATAGRRLCPLQDALRSVTFRHGRKVGSISLIAALLRCSWV